MLIKNGNVLTDAWKFERRDLRIACGIISDIAPAGTLAVKDGPEPEDVYDAEGLYVLPGLVDMHIHACAGYDFCDADEKSIRGMAEFLLQKGVTSFLPASMAYDEEHLGNIFGTARRLIESGIRDGAQIRGIHMEGPFFSKAKKGAQSEKYIIDPDIGFFDRLNAVSGGNIRIVDIAPELPGAMAFIRHASQSATVSIAHTAADYDTAMEAFENGAHHVTHLFNAMPPFLHRSPGPVGAACDAGAEVELISDGFHLHPSVVRSAFRWFGDGKVILVSDAMMACGLPDGMYALGGQDVAVAGGKAVLMDGTLAGSAADLFTCMRRAVDFGIPLESAARAASYNPARSVGIDDVVGSITKGKRADFIFLDRNHLKLVQVILGGRRIRQHSAFGG